MPESTPVNPADAGLEVRSHYVRTRNVMLTRAAFGELYVDYYLHLGRHQVHPGEEHDALFKRALAGFVLHCGSRPWKELTAWTINFQRPLVNLFLTCDNETGAVTGRVFDENVKELPQNVFYSDIIQPGRPKRRSAVNFEGADPFAAIEAFHRQSEQRPARLFQLGEEEFALVTEHPDCDTEWFNNLTADQVRAIEQTEDVNLLERRVYRWHCGCNQERMLEVLAPVMKTDPEGLFGGQETLQIQCPRCAARHTITREALEAFVAKHP